MASNPRINETPRRDPASLHLGLTGLMASGKGEVAKILTGAGFSYLSLSDIVREEAERLSRKEGGGPVSRQQMQDLGNRLREQGGAGILARMVVEKITTEQPGRWVIDGIRNPDLGITGDDFLHGAEIIQLILCPEGRGQGWSFIGLRIPRLSKRHGADHQARLVHPSPSHLIPSMNKGHTAKPGNPTSILAGGAWIPGCLHHMAFVDKEQAGIDLVVLIGSEDAIIAVVEAEGTAIPMTG